MTVVPFHGAWCSLPSVLVAYHSEPLARNMPLALVKSTGLPLETTVFSTGLMTPPVTWLATEDARGVRREGPAVEVLAAGQRVVDGPVGVEHAGDVGQFGVEAGRCALVGLAGAGLHAVPVRVVVRVDELRPAPKALAPSQVR